MHGADEAGQWLCCTAHHPINQGLAVNRQIESAANAAVRQGSLKALKR